MATWWSPTLSRMLGLLCFFCKMIKLLFSGCSTNNNCPESHPICGHGGGDHLCGCNADEDCKSGEICDTEDLDDDGDNRECIPWDCYFSDDCPGHDAICNIPEHENCFYCDYDDMTCKPGVLKGCPTILDAFSSRVSTLLSHS